MLQQEFENYLKINLGAKNSIQTYVYRMKDYFANYSDFTQDNVNAYLAKLVDKQLKPSTFNLSMIACKHYARFLKVEISFPKQKKTEKKMRTFITMEELENELFPYFSMLFPSDYDKRKLILRFMFLTGLRISEVTNLQKENFDFKTDKVTIQNTKGKVDRFVYIHSSIKEAIQQEFNQHKETQNALNITEDWIKYIFYKIKTELNYKKHITPHTLRHASAKFMLKNGMPVNELQTFLGHKDLKTTQIYINASQEEVGDTYFKKVKYKIGRKK